MVQLLRLHHVVPTTHYTDNIYSHYTDSHYTDVGVIIPILRLLSVQWVSYYADTHYTDVFNVVGIMESYYQIHHIASQLYMYEYEYEYKWGIQPQKSRSSEIRIPKNETRKSRRPSPPTKIVSSSSFGLNNLKIDFSILFELSVCLFEEEVGAVTSSKFLKCPIYLET